MVHSSVRCRCHLAREEGAIEAHLDKGVLHVSVKKPPEAVTSAKTIEIKTGAPPKAAE